MTTKKKTIAEDNTPAADTLQTKSAMMTGILAMMAGMKADDMVPWYQDAMALAGGVPDGVAAQNQASVRTGQGAVAEDAKTLFAGDNLSEEAQTRINTLLEHQITLSETVIRQSLEEEYETKLTEATSEIMEGITGKVDQYLSYAVNEWTKNNAVAIESSIRNDRADRILEAIGKIVAEAQLEIPEGEESVVESLRADLAKTKADLSEQIESNIATQEALVKSIAHGVFKDVSEGMTNMDVEKFKNLVENMEISEDADEMRTKLTVIRDANFKKAPGAGGKEGLTEALTEGAPTGGEDDSKKNKEVVSGYGAALSRLANPHPLGGFAR